MLEIIFLILVSCYFIISAVLIVGVKKTFPRLNEEELPTVSILVAARNEENNILSCLESLDNLEYPENKLEIIIVDDASADNTLNIVSDFIHGKQKFRVIYLQTNEVAKLKGKVRAMAEGIKIATGEIILTTDADCVVNPIWAKTIASYYIEGVGVVNGFTSQTASNVFSGMQAIDFIYLLVRYLQISIFIISNHVTNCLLVLTLVILTCNLFFLMPQHIFYILFLHHLQLLHTLHLYNLSFH